MNLGELWVSSAAKEAIAWTMIHFLWIGAVLGAGGAAVRLACRRAAPGVRYAVSLTTFALLAAAPSVIAGWMLQQSGVTDRTAWVSGAASEPLPTRASTTAPQQELPAPAVSSPSAALLDQGSESEGSPIVSVKMHADFPAKSRAFAAWDSLVATAVRCLPRLWLVGSPLTFAYLTLGLVATRRLRQGARPLTEGLALEACERLRRTLGISRRVVLAACDSLVQPVLVGIWRPCILLPAAALAGWSPEQLELVLVHELAHVRRWDNLMNLLQRIVEAALFFHPVVWLASQQVRRDREECCDAIVVGRTQRAVEYAELLVTIASQLRREPRGSSPRGQAPRLATETLVASPLAEHPLAGRIRRILDVKEEPMLVTRGTVGAVIVMFAAVAVAVLTLPPAQADSARAPGSAGGSPDVGAGAAEGEDASAREEMQDAKSDGVGALPFLSPEDQRAADFVYRVLKWEVEPLSDDEMKIVKDQGYEGGVRIVSEESQGFTPGMIHGLLVGVHTRPVRNLAELVEILADKQTVQTSPVRTFMLRRNVGGGFGGGRGGAGWQLLKGRITIKDDEVLRDAINRFRPPRVESVMLDADMHGVDPQLLSLQVFFTQPMQDGSWSWSTADQGEFPETTGEPKFVNDRVCILPVKLKPDTHYAIWINDQKHKNFKGLDGRPAEPFLWEFTTGPAKAKVGEKPASDSASQGKSVDRFASLLYDNLGFTQWQNVWKTELKLDRRVEALAAMNAFARAGQPGAYELMLEYATQYKLPPVWMKPPPTDEHRVLLEVMSRWVDMEGSFGQALATAEPEPTPPWLAPLVGRLKQDPPRYKNLALNLLVYLQHPNDETKRLMREVEKIDDEPLQQSARRLIDWLPLWGSVMTRAGDDDKLTIDELVRRPDDESTLPFPFLVTIAIKRESGSYPGTRYEDVAENVIREEVWPIFAVADADGDGDVTRAELIAAIPAVEKGVAEYKQRHKIVGNGAGGFGRGMMGAVGTSQ
jgi:beta-lactamase regulating signal transducer with metallopeptidase domain